MTHSASLPFNHPCNFNVLMEMAGMEREHCRPALMCVCSERQWLLWRDIANLVNQNFLFWVQSSDGAAGKQGLTALQVQSTSGVMAIVYSVGGYKKVLFKISGIPSASELKRALEEALKEFQEQRKRWLELKRTRDLKQQQDMEYIESLVIDQEKVRLEENSKYCQTEPLEEDEDEAHIHMSL
ncbi:hypothetical protein OS493_022744 [Desmophyllum pertusum]|uniref:Uncharacterized protein n=1 Tax=Desmophyllum pertusum TaxID=174260 RepID=A0A9W9YAK4_9CNID|nr:hypothetical protein OS493_022744 [Desmophyllum pertusum]